MTAVVGPIGGPILGGWITDNITWSWIFFINLPVGLAAAFFTTASFGVLGVIFSPVSGRLADKFDLRWIVTIGLAIFARNFAPGSLQ